MSKNKQAILLIIISVFFGTLMLTFLKLAQKDVNVYVVGFFRFLFGFLIILPYIVKTKLISFFIILDYWRTVIGSSLVWNQLILKSKWGPVDLPVDPTVPIKSPFFIKSPTLTITFSKCE